MKLVFVLSMESFYFFYIFLMGFLNLFGGYWLPNILWISSDPPPDYRYHLHTNREKYLQKTSKEYNSWHFNFIYSKSQFPQLIKSFKCFMLIIYQSWPDCITISKCIFDKAIPMLDINP